MEKKFNTQEEERAYKLGRLDGMIAYLSHAVKNMKNEYEKLYKQRQELINSQEK